MSSTMLQEPKMTQDRSPESARLPIPVTAPSPAPGLGPIGAPAVPACSSGNKRKTVGPSPAHGSWSLSSWRHCRRMATYEVGTDLPLTAAPSGATIRRSSSVVLFITSTSGNDNRGAVAHRSRSLGAAADACQTEHGRSRIRLLRAWSAA